jgi:hypothetical protein
LAHRVAYSAIERMLNNCAKGWESKTSPHKRRIKYNGQYAHLPKNEDEIYAQKVKKMVRDLQIDRKCAEKYLGFSIEIPAAR